MEEQFYLPVRLLGGRDAVRRNAARFAALGKRCLLVTGRSSAEKSGALADVTAALGENAIAWEVFSGIGENPRLDDCERAAAQAIAFGADFVVGIGGGVGVGLGGGVGFSACVGACVGCGLAGASYQGKNHHEGKKQSDEFLHGISSCVLFWFYLLSGKSPRLTGMRKELKTS